MYSTLLEQAEMPAGPPNAVTSDSDAIKLLILREIEASGPMTGLDAINRVASTARLLGIASPGYALLHGLAEGDLLECVAGRPRRYRITDVGSREAEHLAERCWPRLRGEVVHLGRRLAPARPKAKPHALFVTEWADESMDLGR
jgi:DNA-binding PadR family transcriptional regulator